MAWHEITEVLSLSVKHFCVSPGNSFCVVSQMRLLLKICLVNVSVSVEVSLLGRPGKDDAVAGRIVTGSSEKYLKHFIFKCP